MEVLGSVDLSCDVQLFLLLLNLILGTVADANGTSTSLLFLSPLRLIDFMLHGFMAYILECRLVDDSLCHHHVCLCLLQVD